ncbi:uncharacterized protein LOC108106468 isoform X2 [Drosophila eugracilis]|uniref:uncharacterized protein LOC108106468 isoform X2 n=1 Tax=Drosophila eugracilis TaxID=29029 RepID=UPI0007E7066B|nr:uncharacterized protein LOC108106468 isoform X2 [Drosophila eugracilis]
MIKLYLTLILFGLLKPLTTLKLDGENATICVDCSKDDYVDCRIGTTGFECFVDDMLYKEIRSTDLSPFETLDLKVCIPDDLKIDCIKDEKFEKVIVWSPELGCQIVNKKGHKEHTCFSASLICPCIKDKKGSGNVHKNCWLVSTIIALMQLYFN